jgi:hypothetical protein
MTPSITAIAADRLWSASGSAGPIAEGTAVSIPSRSASADRITLKTVVVVAIV